MDRTGKQGWRGLDITSLLIGAGVAFVISWSGQTIAADDGDRTLAVQGFLYAISELAIDTEVNASRIVDLDDRLDALEAKLAELIKKDE
ncbi:MAG: hypothetical protein AAGD13_13200 [Pseudomonadota bacterium]